MLQDKTKSQEKEINKTLIYENKNGVNCIASAQASHDNKKTNLECLTLSDDVDQSETVDKVLNEKT